jgi:hypothetical protein
MGVRVTIKLDLLPDIEKGLLAQAAARGVSLLDYVNEIVVREAHVTPKSAHQRTGQELIDVCAKVRGLLTDEEVDTLFSRSHSLSRPVDLE